MDDLLDSRAAAALLGVRRATLYSYVSRGLLTPVPGPDHRSRRYRRADLQRLKVRGDARRGHGAAAAAALRWGPPVVSSSICQLLPARGPLYRGRAAVDLVEAGAGFEEVAEVLWDPSASWSPPARLDPPEAWSPAAAPRGLPEALAGLPPAEGPLLAMALALPTLAAADQDRVGAPDPAERARARSVLARLADLVVRRRRGFTLSSTSPGRPRSVASRVLGGGSSKRRSLVDAALILCADHELNASTFAARVAASTGADLYACLAAALGTLSGPRHGGACDRIEAMLEGPAQGVDAALTARLRRGEEVPGFGHRLYPDGDPRAACLLAAARALAPRRLAAVDAACRVMERAGHPPPGLDLALVAAARALGLAPGAASGLFALGRAAGWVAHALEQRTQGFMVRPRAAFAPDPGPDYHPDHAHPGR